MIGQNFQGWKIEECIGEGGFGKVYRITRNEFSHTYEAALKVIDIPQSQSEVNSFKNEGMTNENVTAYFQSMVEKIVEEFTLMSRLKGNSNIVSYEDHYVEKKQEEFGWRIYIRMELLTPLFTHVKEHGLTEQDIIKIGIDICRSLELCKLNNIIHRDIKPENIFVSSIGDYKLGDFGIARELEKTSAGLTKVGTKNYMAPEVYKGYEYNSTVDIYSLGIVLYRFLNDNRLPFMPPAPQVIKYSDQELAYTMRFSGQPIPKPSKASNELAEIILKACAYEPVKRYATAKEMRKELERLKHEDVEEVNFETSTPDYTPNVDDDYREQRLNAEKKTEFDEKDNIENSTVMLFNSTLQEPTSQISEPKISQEQKSNTRYEMIEMLSFDDNAIKVPYEYETVNTQSWEEKKKKKPIVLIGSCVAIIAVLLGMIGVVLTKNNKKETLNQRLISLTSDATLTPEKAEATTPEETVVSEAATPEEVAVPEATTPEEAAASKPEKTSAPVKLISIPSLKGLSIQKAKSKLKKLGLKYTVKKKYNTKAKGIVISQSIKAKTKVKKGKKVTIVVSKGKKLVPVAKAPSYSNRNSNTRTQRSSSSKSKGTSTQSKKKTSNSKSDGTFKQDKKKKTDGTFQ